MRSFTALFSRKSETCSGCRVTGSPLPVLFEVLLDGLALEGLPRWRQHRLSHDLKRYLAAEALGHRGALAVGSRSLRPLLQLLEHLTLRRFALLHLSSLDAPLGSFVDELLEDGPVRVLACELCALLLRVLLRAHAVQPLLHAPSITLELG
eukprot:CAMPEP_0177736060 /NCGR_PEP_ID=MMETSP0484_2-20121128/25121_1 /TAXON_ID=354590 /ORGANISM="Rhodomonas lens, Strain RHODO" /LENGTH=150 /DNA_ID=CAMNT_0019249691 /DNA_START=520 /DNA_END=971 /DNA_ORIENTATION=+